MLTITIAVVTTPDTPIAAIDTERRIAQTSGVIPWVASDAGLVNALVYARITTIKIFGASNAINAAVDGLRTLLDCVGRVWPISVGQATVCAEYEDWDLLNEEAYLLNS